MAGSIMMNLKLKCVCGGGGGDENETDTLRISAKRMLVACFTQIHNPCISQAEESSQCVGILLMKRIIDSALKVSHACR